MERLDRLGELARRQLDSPLRDFAFVGAMIAMLVLSFVAVTGAASSLVATASPAPQICKSELASRLSEKSGGCLRACGAASGRVPKKAHTGRT